MLERIKYGLLIALAVSALAAAGIVLYNFHVNDWRMPNDISALFDLGFIVGEEEPDYEKLERGVLRHADFDAETVATIVIDGADSDIRIGRGRIARLEVEMILYGEASDTSRFDADARMSGSTLEIVSRPRPGKRAGARAVITVTLPEMPTAHEIRLTLAHGNALVSGFLGACRAEVSDGGIQVSDASGRIELMATGGNISVARCRGEGRIEVTGGEATMELNEGNWTVTASSSVTAHNHFGTLAATVRSGHITAQVLTDEPTCTLVTEVGDVTLSLLPGARTTFDVHVPSGRFLNDLPVDSLLPRPRDPASWAGTLNGGGPTVRIDAGTGDVILKEYTVD